MPLTPGSMPKERRDQPSNSASADASYAEFTAQEMNLNHEYLKKMGAREQQTLQRIGARGGAYDRLEAAGFPVP